MRYRYEDFLRELGAKLRKMRKDQGWTLRQMIVHHGFHLAQWQGFEKGKGISVPTLLRLCDVFNVTLEELVGGIGKTFLEEDSGSIKVPPTAAGATERRAPKRVPPRGGSRPPREPRKE